MVVEAAPVVPGEEDRGRTPVRAAHDPVDQPGDIGLAVREQRRRVIAHLLGRRDPRDRRERPRLRLGKEVAERADVGELVVDPHRVEVRHRVPDPRRLRVHRHRLAEHGAAVAVRLGAVEDVVAPADVILVQEPGEVGPGVVGNRPGRVLRLPGRRPWRLHRGPAAHRVVLLRALRRPARDHVQVHRHAPRGVRLEHVVLEYERLRPGPVVRQLALIVVGHHRLRLILRIRACRSVEMRRTRKLAATMSRLDEPVHLAVIDIPDRIRVVMRPAQVKVSRGMERTHAMMGERVRHANRGTPLLIGIPSAPGKVPKNESNDRFSCMMITTCRILWIPVSAAACARGTTCRAADGTSWNTLHRATTARAPTPTNRSRTRTSSHPTWVLLRLSYPWIVLHEPEPWVRCSRH